MPDQVSVLFLKLFYQIHIRKSTLNSCHHYSNDKSNEPQFFESGTMRTSMFLTAVTLNGQCHKKCMPDRHMDFRNVIKLKQAW
jgi:hypothetical protein